MRWIWGSRCLKGDEVERDEKAKRCRNKKCKADIGALVGCRKAYPLGNGVEDDASASACRALEEKVIYCYAKQYCPESAAAYEHCFHDAVKRRRFYEKDTGEKACDGQLRKMKKCLLRSRALPCELNIH
mmetsp:Transcript_3592/g.8981  ORF Transcript_3592/g.8981 Transcript_3592/m.8981 type:complete len:129 (+) Transcript_3592:219-605(+)